MAGSPDENEEAERLLDLALEAAGNAYAPYSRFQVGAVVVDADGREYRGANVENAAYGPTLCAEAVAIGTAVASGARELTTVAVSCRNSVACYPCGNCRQLMQEFAIERVIVRDPEGGARIHSIEELLPHAFGPGNLAEAGELTP